MHSQGYQFGNSIPLGIPDLFQCGQSMGCRLNNKILVLDVRFSFPGFSSSCFQIRPHPIPCVIGYRQVPIDPSQVISQCRHRYLLFHHADLLHIFFPRELRHASVPHTLYNFLIRLIKGTEGVISNIFMI